MFELLELLEDIRGGLEQGQEDDRPSVRMVIVDSVSALMAPLLGGNQVDGKKYGQLYQSFYITFAYH